MSEFDVATMAEYDLSKTIIPYLDRHLAIPLLNHLAELALSPVVDVQAAQYELAKGTNMVDFTVSVFEELNPDTPIPDEFAAKRENALSTNERLQQEAQAGLDNLQNLKDNYNLTPAQITALYAFGQFQFTYGNYSGAANYLYHFRVLSTDANLLVSAHWGKLASDILTGKWDIALEELHTLRNAIDARSNAHGSGSGGGGAARAQLHSRTWLAHWSLFVYFNHPNGRTLLETFLSPTYLATIQTACPWILRVKHALKEIVKVIQTEEYQYTDPLTRTLNFIYVDFDFEAAQRDLASASAMVRGDFFLGEFKDKAARGLVSEVYVRIHQRIDIGDLSKRLNLGPEEGEKWIVNLIREPRMGADAKIDLEKGSFPYTTAARRTSHKWTADPLVTSNNLTGVTAH
ncbi:eukaryotic translation initiation factor 3, subunit 6 [Athelia psychrophila]|uniref:Eukaryotic translation initiation factor 3 subunit E n=1 Tax=Athelia psychrophila TaxID=1759441 RepID=A0A165WK95_9AGAM|nr:eukaryotic translation initiation factor 3, subunit 6 [Fibularhizoctonia sp. CBS 109695]